jgi:23S rRNA pseudouridine2605 synthase
MRRTPDIHALLPIWEFGYNVGRLIVKGGVLLVTNDGELASRMMHPLIMWARNIGFGASCFPIRNASMREGVDCQGECLRAGEIHLDHATEDSCCYAVLLHEGKNRQIRRMFSALYVPVIRLLRVAIGPLRLGTLKPGEWRHMTESEVRSLYSITNDMRNERPIKERNHTS